MRFNFYNENKNSCLFTPKVGGEIPDKINLMLIKKNV